MNIFKILLIIAIHFTGKIALAVDAPMETFFIQPEKIHPEALKNIQAIITITFLDPGYHYVLPPQPVKIQGHPGRSEQSEIMPMVLTLENIRPLSGVDYEQIVIRRFPVTEVDGNLFEIVYDLEKNLRTWVYIMNNTYIRTSVGQFMPVEVTSLTENGSVNFHPDIFYLLNGDARRFYESPQDDASYFDVSDEEGVNNIPFRTEKKFINSLQITEIVNGFAKVSTSADIDGELTFAGWIKMAPGGVLTVWQTIVMYY
jgi:hypothetical protein